MSDPRFTVKSLEEAKQFLDKLDDKAREKIFITYGNPEVSTTKNYSKSLTGKFGNSELHTINLHIGS